VRCVTRIYTDRAVFLVTPDGLKVRETYGCTFEQLLRLVGLPLLKPERERRLNS